MKKIILILLSAGWVVPLYLSILNIIRWGTAESSQTLGGDTQLNSFPFLHYSEQSLTIACVWLLAVLVYWLVKYVRKA